MKLILHVCCAPCSIQCIQALAEEGIGPELLWYNPNINPYTEYCSRRDALKAFAESRALPLIEPRSTLITENNNKTSCSSVSSVVKNCASCYRLRLEKTARLAAIGGFDAFSSTLLISPYQNHELIKKIGEELAAEHGLEFLYRDFRGRFREGQRQARQAGYYMQKYCGCIHSQEESLMSQARRGRK